MKTGQAQVEPFHLFRYLDEQTYRFNERKNKDGDKGRFMDIVKTTTGRRLTWKETDGEARGKRRLADFMGRLWASNQDMPQSRLESGVCFVPAVKHCFLAWATAFVFFKSSFVFGLWHRDNFN